MFRFHLKIKREMVFATVSSKNYGDSDELGAEIERMQVQQVKVRQCVTKVALNSESLRFLHDILAT